MTTPPLPPRRSIHSPSTLRSVVRLLGGLLILASIGACVMFVAPALREWFTRPTSGTEFVLALETDPTLDAATRQADARCSFLRRVCHSGIQARALRRE